MLFNGQEISMEELNKKMAELKMLQSLQKEAKKAGLITAKAVTEKKEKSANYNLMLANWMPVIETNLSIIAELFKEFDGQDSISFDCGDKYHVIIRSKEIVKAKQDARKATKTEAPSEAKTE